MWDGHLESRKNPDRLKRSIHVDRIGVHSTFVYIYAGLRALMIWANCLFPFKMSFLLRKVDDVTTISKSQSLTSVSIKDCTLRVPNETTPLFLLRVIIKTIFIHSVFLFPCDRSFPSHDSKVLQFTLQVSFFLFSFLGCLIPNLITRLSGW